MTATRHSQDGPMTPGCPLEIGPRGTGFSSSGMANQALFRLDLRRSLQLHLRLAAGIALLGLIGAVAYFHALWPVYSTQSESGVLRNALVIAMAGFILAIVAATGANKLDQKVYVASDVERVLGFAPMAVLPDFDEVSDGVAEEHLLRLAAGIEYARQQGKLRNCIFTGTGSGTGVSSVITRVGSVLETMGRTTVLVDASGSLPPEPLKSAACRGEASTQLSTERASRSTVLLQQMTARTKEQDESVVLTDAAPLAVSAEAEYLARFVDAAFVVVESGVTTRAELRLAASTLQRLEVGTIGFVLNRVGLKKADPAFRQSIKAIESHLGAQRRAISRNTNTGSSLPTLAGQRATAAASRPRPRPQADSKPELGPADLPLNRETPPSARGPEPKQSPFEPFTAGQLKAALGPDLPSDPSGTAPERSWADSWKPVAAQPQQAQPKPPADQAFAAAPGPFDRPFEARHYQVPHHQAHEALTQPRIEPQSELSAEKQPGPNTEAPYDAAARMSGLRNLISSLGLKNPQRPSDANAQPYPAPSPEPVRERLVYAPCESPARSSEAEKVSPGPASARVTAFPEILPPTPSAPTVEEDDQDGNGASGRRDRRAANDEVEILPSRRGQYKKKD